MNDSNADKATTSAKSRPAFRFTIRTILVLMTGLAVFLAHRTHIARREAPALKLVREHGCTPLYRHDIFGNLPSFAPNVVRETIGIENFGSVVRLNFAEGQPKSDDAFAMLGRLPNVTVLNSDGALISNSGLAPIASLSQLTCLRLNNAKNISDDGVKHLAELKDLNMLNLSGTGVTDLGLAHLQGLTKLQSLNLENTVVTDEGIKQLDCLGQLEYLQLQNTAVTLGAINEFKSKHPDCQIVHDLVH